MAGGIETTRRAMKSRWSSATIALLDVVLDELRLGFDRLTALVPDAVPSGARAALEPHRRQRPREEAGGWPRRPFDVRPGAGGRPALDQRASRHLRMAAGAAAADAARQLRRSGGGAGAAARGRSRADRDHDASSRA